MTKSTTRIARTTVDTPVGLFRDGRPIAGATHDRGRLSGYAIRGSATSAEDRPDRRVVNAARAEADTARRGGDLAALLAERARFGRARATAPEGGLSLGDAFQPERERRAAGIGPDLWAF